MIGDAEHHHAPGERFLAQFIERFQAVHTGHIQVKQDQIRIERFGQFNALFAVTGFAHDGDIRGHADKLFYAGAQHRMVVD